MQDLAIVILGIVLGIGVIFFVPLILTWRKLLRTRFPMISKWWWFLWSPILVVASFLLAIVVLRIVVLFAD